MVEKTSDKALDFDAWIWRNHATILRIEIENLNSFKIQLLHRDWYIFDSLNDATFVSGEGVIGEQPTLRPDEKYIYTSGAELASEIGFMKGFYTFRNLGTDTNFQVFVPTFHLLSPPRLN